MTTQVAQSGQGGLPPLEYSDCFLDSPTFREVIVLYEKEMENNYYLVKNLVKQCDSMIQATKEYSKMQQTFAQHLGSFKFQTIGEQSEDEKMISNSLQTFARLLMSIEDCRQNMLSTISVRLLQTLENFRKEQIQKTREEKKKFDRATDKYYKELQNHLSANSKRKDLFEADSSIERERAQYRQTAFEYVCNLQDVHAQKQYEIIEPIIGYVNDMSTFLHQAYDEATSTKQELQSVQFKVQILREVHESEMEKAYQLKAKIIEEGEAGLIHHPEFLRQGHVYVQDSSKKMALHSWHRYFCQFRKKDIASQKVKQVRFYPVGHQGLMPSQEFVEVKDCVRCKGVDVDRRFCFEVDLAIPNGNRKYLIQAMSEEDRKSWLEIMEGKEPVYSSLKVIELTAVNEQGYEFIRRCIDEIETRGLEEEGIYRKPGIISKATKLYKTAIERGKMNSINLTNEEDWDTKTIASAVKGYLSKQLEEPILTFALHSQFIECAKIGDREKRLDVIKDLVDQLPEINRRILVVLIEHLYNIAQKSNFNLMKASNLGVVFGPTLMRAEVETVATIVDIKYQNIIVQEMIEQKSRVLYDSPVSSRGAPAIPPPRQPIGDKRPPNKRNSDPPTSRPPNPPFPGNPTIPPPSITCYSNKSPEPHQYEVPVTSGSRPLESSDSIRRKPPPIPKSKPPLTEPQKRMSSTSVGSPPDTPSNHTKPRRQSAGGSSRVMAQAAKVNRGLPVRPPRKNKGPSARALYDCAGDDEQELSFSKGEILYNVEESAEEPQWLMASKDGGKRGLVPSNYVEMLP